MLQTPPHPNNTSRGPPGLGLCPVRSAATHHTPHTDRSNTPHFNSVHSVWAGGGTLGDLRGPSEEQVYPWILPDATLGRTQKCLKYAQRLPGDLSSQLASKAKGSDHAAQSSIALSDPTRVALLPRLCVGGRHYAVRTGGLAATVHLPAARPLDIFVHRDPSPHPSPV